MSRTSMPETCATAVMVAKVGLIWTRSIFDNVLPREPCRIFGGGLRQVAWPGASFSLAPNRAGGPGPNPSVAQRHITRATRFGDALRFQQFECCTSDGLGESTDDL
jgi:hypothetical protein